MAAPWRGLSTDQRQTMTMVGVGVIGAASVLGGLLWVIRRQIVSGDMIKVRLVHELEPDTRNLVQSYLPLAKQISDQGVDVNLRLFRKRAEEEGLDVSDLLGALAPLSTVEDATFGRKSVAARPARHPLPSAASFSEREGDLWLPMSVEITGGGQMLRGFVEANKLPLRTGGVVALYQAGSPPGSNTFLGRYRRKGTRGFLSLLEQVG